MKYQIRSYVPMEAVSYIYIEPDSNYSGSTVGQGEMYIRQ